MDFSRIKLVIWDLDETLWTGVLSDGAVILPEENKELLHSLADHGIVCSICSKNDEKSTLNQLKEFGINDLFVFKSINWSPKGERVKQIIDEMQLRAVNCLFIDDNPSNRGEVLSACKDLSVADVDIIPQLISYLRQTKPKDLEHKRLKQYKVLETKKVFRANFADNEEFLFNSNIRVAIMHDCNNHIGRITELIQRSNQLNFTKVRSTEGEIAELLHDESVESGYIQVSDNFGDYGIVGFYAVKNKHLIHFVFSCRTLGMGIEQYTYQQIGTPTLNVVGEVASDVNHPNPRWINHGINQSGQKAQIADSIVLKGPCDLQQIFAYIADKKSIIKEFTYVGENGVSIEGHNHTSQILESQTLSEDVKVRMSKKYPFSDKNMFITKAFDEKVGFVVLSLFTDPNLGLYQDKETGVLIAFGEWTTDITDSNNEEALISQKVFTSNCTFTKENLEFIRNNLCFLGRLSPEQVFCNIKKIYKELSASTHLILVLGSETPFLGNKQESYENRDKYNQILNSLIRGFSQTETRIHCLDVNKFIHGQEDFTNNINHFNRQIYYSLSQELINIIQQNSDMSLKHYNQNAAKVISFVRRVNNKIRQVFS